MISGHGTIRDAVEATRSGAFDFLEKPLARDRVLLVVKNALERADLQRENQRFRELVGEAPRMIGKSAAFQHAVQQATQVARSDVGVLLSGESGTGKELLAAHIHRESPFASGPFVKVNCAAIPTELIESELFGHEKGAFTGAAAMRRGKFELADGGTIFLDEVGDLHEASQAKLLRILQDGELQRVGGEQSIRVAVRVVSATNRRLDELIAAGKFREDLYYRLSVVPIRVPALRERSQDIGELVAYFLGEFCARNNFRRREIDPDVVCRCSSATTGRATCASCGTSSSAWRSSPPATESRRNRSRSRSASRRRRDPGTGFRRCATRPSANASARRWTRPTGTSPARRGCLGPNAPACTNGSERSTSGGVRPSATSRRLHYSTRSFAKSDGCRPFRSACQLSWHVDPR